MSEENEVGFGKPPKHTQFKKGQSGNPKGRPPDKERKAITHALRELLESSVDKHDLAKAMAKVAFKLALSGDFRFWNAIMERLDGKVADQIQADHDHTITVVYEAPELPRESVNLCNSVSATEPLKNQRLISGPTVEETTDNQRPNGRGVIPGDEHRRITENVDAAEQCDISVSNGQAGDVHYG